MRLIVIITAFFLVMAGQAYADQFDVSVAFSSSYDADNSDVKGMVEFKQKDEEDIYRNKLSFYLEQSKDSTHVKTKDLFDYEQNFKYFGSSKESFVAAYYRYKKDKFLDGGDNQNYEIYSIGSGFEQVIKGHITSFELYVGKHTGSENIEIIRPKISIKRKLDDVSYQFDSSYVRGANFLLNQNKIEAKYFIRKNIYVKYLLSYEKSEDVDDSITHERKSLLALGFKF